MNPIQDRFWDKVNKRGAGGCWLWTASVVTKGYGQFRVGGRNLLAHRLALEWEAGQCPAGQEACHSCGNRRCVNPEHLRWDTPSANAADKLKHGTNNSGESNSAARLTNAQALEIREAVASGERQTDVARRYGVSKQNVHAIFHGRAWRHLPR